jgi:hypothetical protein
VLLKTREMLVGTEVRLDKRIKLYNLNQLPFQIKHVDNAIYVGNSGSPGLQVYSLESSATGEPETLLIGICGARSRPQTLHLFFEGPP